MAKYQLRLLGGFALHGRDGRPVALSSKKAAALLAYLCHRPGAAVSRSKIAALLWPDRGEDQARSSPRQTLSVLRKALDNDAGTVIVAAAQDLSVASDVITVDSVEFEAAETGAEAAADLYQGAFLDGFDIRAETFEDWLRGERARLAAHAARIFSLRLEQCQDRNEHDEALNIAIKLLALDPLREDIHRLVMGLYQQQGHWNEALRQYQDCRDILEAELGVEPEDETRALYDEIKNQRDGAPSASKVEAAALRRFGSHPAIAVMPFENLGDDPDQTFFADGITEDIITELSRFPTLFVVARNSAFSYKDRAFAVDEVGAEFGVQYLVKGSVRKASNQVRLTAQLLETGSGTHIWAERYDRELADIFALQDELTRAIVAVLPGRVENYQARSIGQKPPRDMAAYELLLAGKIHHHRYSEADCVAALDLLNRAIGLEPDYAAAHAWKACVLGQALARGYLPDPESLFNGAVTAVDTALRLDENEVEAHRVQAEIAIVTKRLDAAVQHNERALSLNPNDPRLVAQKGELLTLLGQASEGSQWINMAMRLDPYSSAHWAHLLGTALMLSGRYEEALAAYGQSAWPRSSHHANMAGCLAMLGQTDDAAGQAAMALELQSDFTISAYIDGMAYRHEAERKQHRDILGAAPLPI
ncbi:MAG: BTAD domain-containing putative transcriptional regulator [Alphaproteobacteria bacterium]|nr:BTAD domain-containing putative transcriptional regulator [Alphaproteobacteria bacterium]